MSEKILVIAAHPDDEILGCGATIAKKVHKEKAEVSILILSKGILSRNIIKNKKKSVNKNLEAAKKASKYLGVKNIKILNLKDNELDSYTKLSIIKKIEQEINRVKPNTIYTHFNGDLNIDHQIISECVITATRPIKDTNLNKIYFFEVLSSTDFNFGAKEKFEPNHFENIETFIDYKIKAIKIYKDEMRKFPHSRSIENVLNLSKLRGSQMFKKHAEAFILVKSYS